MSWAVVAGSVLAAGGTAYGAKQSREAADAGVEGQRAGIALTQEQFQRTREDLTPYRKSGERALDIISRTMGLGGGGGDPSLFESSPGYQFRLAEGNKALDRSAAARGLRLSGSQLKDLTRFNQGMASQEFGNWYSRLADLAAGGQNAAVQTGQFGANAAARGAQGYGNIGAIQGQGIQDRTNFVTSGLEGLSTYLGQQRGQTRQSGYSSNRSPLEDIWRGAAMNTFGR